MMDNIVAFHCFDCSSVATQIEYQICIDTIEWKS